MGWQMIPCQETCQKGEHFLVTLPLGPQLPWRNCDPGEDQEQAVCLGEEQRLRMGPGAQRMTQNQSKVSSASVHTQKKSIHCIYVSCTELVMQPQLPGAACSHTEIIQSHLQQPPSHLVHIFPFPIPVLPCLHVSVSKEITKGEIHFFSVSC